ncbi:hypothetical protein [Flavobacterium cellulosilyticum]|uniref:hypothetical protein n=1 Tax=Flavobacterium cellulosilyticum TaxID=2541731 RepID=UPI001FE6F206|nr:hypothetical protein [Flavobacterium cellulosilyticum]
MSLYPWSSYETIISDKPTKLMRNEVIEIFGGIEDYIFFHNQEPKVNEINNLIIEY